MDWWTVVPAIPPIFADPSPAPSPIETGSQQPLSGRPPPRFAPSHPQLHLAFSVLCAATTDLTFLPRLKFEVDLLHFRPPNSNPSPSAVWSRIAGLSTWNRSAISELRHRSLEISCPSLIKTKTKQKHRQNSGLTHGLQLALTHSIPTTTVRIYTRILDCRNFANSYIHIYPSHHPQLTQHSISHRNCHHWTG